MKKLLFSCLLFMICLMLSAPVAAQIYKYETEDGQVMYTNDYAQIPAQYRDQLTTADETVPKKPDQTLPSKDELMIKRDEYTARQDALTQTFQALSEKQQALEEKRATIPMDDDNAWEQFNAELTELNREIDVYKKESEEFVREVQEFNGTVDRVNNP